MITPSNGSGDRFQEPGFMLASGAQLGPYEIRAPLGAGGMGEVYRAKDSRLDRDVAIKVLPTQFAQDGARLARFEREAKVVAALSHPNILAIHDYGIDQGQSFAVMELLEGETLRERVAHGAIPWRRAIEIGVAIADGLAAAHAKGIIHRDLKPENIFLTAAGWVKVLDFGLARIEPVAPSAETPTGSYHAVQTDAGAIMGTVGYMSPEQVRGREVDGRSDVFSLGCVLHEMVTGQRAFARESAVETMTAILHDEPPDLADSGKNVPLELNRLIRHCLEKNREGRFQSAQDLAFALRAIQSDSNISSTRTMASGASRRPLAFWTVAVCALLGVAVSASLLVPWLRHEVPTSQASKPGQAFASLAILPLANVTDDPQGEPLCEGLAEHLSGRLSQVRELKVRPITSTVHYRGKTVDAKTVGRELDVHAVVTGRLRQEGETLVIALELVDASDNSLVWSHQYKGNRQQILDLQDELTRDLATTLGLRLTGEEQQRLTRRYTEDPEAYLLYREGQYHWSKFSEEGLKTATEYFQRAVQQDPEYALAHAGLGRCYILLGTIHRGPLETFPEAKKHIAQALAIDDTVADAHYGLGVIYLFGDWNWPAAEREFKRAMALDPNFASHQLYGFYLAAMGRPSDAIPYIQRDKELAPLVAQKSYELAMCYNWTRQYDRAIAEARKAVDLDPNFFLAYGELGLAYTQKGMHDEALVELRKAPNFAKGHPGILGWLGYAHAMAGQRAEAQKVLDELIDRSKLRFGCAFAITKIHAALGEKDQAFEWLQKACEERHPSVIWLKVIPAMDNLRSDPRFDAILQDMGLAEKAIVRKEQPIDSLAVLPFENQSPDPEAGYLGDDITYSLTDSLARVRELKVRPYSSAARFKAGSFDAKAAGRELQVQALLRGSVQQRGETVVIDVELVHVGDDRRMWGDRYQAKLAERLTLQQQIIQEVTERLRLSLTGQEKQTLAKLPTQSLKAHELYIQGRLEWNKVTRLGLEKSLGLFREAIDQDSNHALAWAGLAEAYKAFPIATDSPAKDFIPQAKTAATRALEIDDQLVEAQAALAWIAAIYEWDWSEAERRFQRALAINPNHPAVRFWYSQYLATLGRFDDAQVHSQRAQELDPTSLVIRTIAGRHFYYAGQYDAAIKQYQKTFASNPNFWIARLFLGQAYARKGQYEEAIGELQRVRQLPDANLEALASLGHLYAVMGRTADAQQVLDELTKLSEQRYVPSYYFAVVHAARGEKEQALNHLDKACQDRNHLVVKLKFDPMFDSLRDEPRFQKIVADMKFPE